MKIIIVGTAHPYRGGLASFNERLALELQNEGHCVEIFTFQLQYPSFLFPGKTQFTNSSAPNIKITRLINSINPFNWLKAGRIITNKQPDVVIFAYWLSFMSPCFGTIARTIKKRCNAKCIGLIHNMLPHEPSIIDRILPGYFVNSIDGFFALSKSVITDIEKFEKNQKPKMVSPHPIYNHYGELLNRSQALAKLNLQESNNYILFFGFIRDYKGLDVLMEALAEKRMEENNVYAIIAGEFYGNEEIYKTLAKDLNIENRIFWFSEYIPDNEVNTFFSAADIVVQPYKTATQSGVTQICYHFEKPMIVTNVGGLAEIVPDGKTGYVIEANNSTAIVNAISDFFSNNRKDSFVKNFEEEKKKYSWNILTERLYELIKES